MPELTRDEALATLRRNLGYDWLTGSGRQLWDAEDVHAALSNAGMKVEKTTVLGWFKSMPNTQSFGGRGGMYAARDDLLVFFARRVLGADRDDDGKRAG